jgi:hypothetical protein
VAKGRQAEKVYLISTASFQPRLFSLEDSDAVLPKTSKPQGCCDALLA